MGWSCTRAAGDTMQEWVDECLKQTQSQNVYRNRRGDKQFWEHDRVEHADGAITGEIWRYNGNNNCIRVCGFRIEPNGDVLQNLEEMPS